MEIVGYIGYGILIIFAIIWTLGVRIKLGTAIPTVLGALFFLASVIVLFAFEISKIHSFWLLPSGFAFVMICSSIISARIPLLSGILKIIGSLYASIIRLGISKERIKAAQHLDAMETVQNWQKENSEK